MKLQDKSEYVNEIFDNRSLSEGIINQSKFNNCSFRNARLKEIRTRECFFFECDILPARSLTLTNEDSLKELARLSND